MATQYCSGGEVWLDQVSLKDSYHDLFSTGSNQNKTINDCWSPQGWNLHFRRNLNDWEVKRVARLLTDIEAPTGLTNVSDTIRWRYNSDGFFSYNRAYNRGIRGGAEGNSILWRNIWENIAPTKVRCFSWLVARRACLTQEVLQRKGLPLVPREAM